MKVLIVDDEQYIREGIANLLEWEKLGITKIQTAANGVNGIREAKKMKPDIVITDIRMPRMTGIQMVEKLLQMDPDCCSILLSAHSDIPYFRAAIKMKTMDFLSKPVQKDELEDVVRKAIKERRMRLEQKRMYLQFHRGQLNRLVQDLIVPNSETVVQNSLIELDMEDVFRELPYITTIILKFRIHDQEDIWGMDQQIQANLYGYIHNMKMELLWMMKDEKYIVLELFGKKEEISLSDRKLLSIRLVEMIDSVSLCYIAWGNTVYGMDRAYESYQTAAWQIQKCFFETYGTAYFHDEKTVYFPIEKYQLKREQIVCSIEEMEQYKILDKEMELYQLLKTKKNSYIQNIKNIYSSFYHTLHRQAELLHLNLEEEKDDMLLPWKTCDKKQVYRQGNNRMIPNALSQPQTEDFNLDELHGYFVKHVNRIFKIKELQLQEQPTITAIKNYIKENYRNPLLSLKEISDYIHISTSRICTVFKQETGITINQYLTKVRMEKAQKYLKNSRYNVVDICRTVGYRDNSYFGKIFREYFKMSPLEYREEWLGK